MKSMVLFVTLLGVMAAVAFATENRFEAMRLAADEMVNTLEEETTPENKEKVSALERLLADLIEKIRVRVDERHQSAQDLLVKVKEVVSRLTDLHASKSEKITALIERIHGRVREAVSSLIDKLTGRPRSNLRSASNQDPEELLKELELEKLLLNTFILTATEKSESRVRRDAETTTATTEEKKKNTFDAIKDMFKGITDHIFGRYTDFLDWLQTVWGKGIEKAKGHHARIVAIAKEVIADAKTMHKETLREALEILRPYRKELGSMWNELVEAVNKALKQQ